MRLLKRWSILGVVVALVVALVLPACAVMGSGNDSTMYLTKHKKPYLLTATSPDHKGTREEHTDKIYPAKPYAVVYQVLGIWNSVPMTSPLRIINLGVANLGLSVTDNGGYDDSKNKDDKNKDAKKVEQASVQVKVEVLQNGNVMVSKESESIILQFKGTAPTTVIDLPAPNPAIELVAGDVYSIRVSVRDGGLTTVKSYKVRLDYDGTKAPSNFSLETSTAPPATGLIEVGQPSFIDAAGRIYITPTTPVSFFIDVDVDMSLTTVTISSPSTGVIPYPASQGNNVIRFQNLNFDDYTVRVDAVTLSGQTRSDLVEVTLVDVLPQ